jgi:hypothetical protein
VLFAAVHRGSAGSWEVPWHAAARWKVTGVNQRHSHSQHGFAGRRHRLIGVQIPLPALTAVN